MLNISEIFGPTIQGEGPLVGHPTIFLRVYGCNLDCSWCDSKYAIRGGDNSKQSIEQIVNKIQKLDRNDCEDVTITGGEPMLYIGKLIDVMKKIPHYSFHFETNGTIFPAPYLGALSDLNVSYIVSPKLHAICDDYVEQLKHWADFYDVCFKFVYENADSVTQIHQLMEKIPSVPIYIMPEGITFNQKKYDEAATVCFENNFILSPRLHNIIWGNTRGV